MDVESMSKFVEERLGYLYMMKGLTEDSVEMVALITFIKEYEALQRFLSPTEKVL